MSLNSSYTSNNTVTIETNASEREGKGKKADGLGGNAPAYDYFQSAVPGGVTRSLGGDGASSFRFLLTLL